MFKYGAFRQISVMPIQNDNRECVNGARYEEKTFESYFNNELDRKTSIYFPLGQVQEGVLGLDSVAHSRGWFLWRKLGYPFWLSPQFSGVELRETLMKWSITLAERLRTYRP